MISQSDTLIITSWGLPHLSLYGLNDSMTPLFIQESLKRQNDITVWIDNIIECIDTNIRKLRDKANVNT